MRFQRHGIIMFGQHFPACLADALLRNCLDLIKGHPTGNFSETVFLILLPVPVRTHLRQAAKAFLTLVQRFLHALDIADVGGNAIPDNTLIRQLFRSGFGQHPAHVMAGTHQPVFKMPGRQCLSRGQEGVIHGLGVILMQEGRHHMGICVDFLGGQTIQLLDTAADEWIADLAIGFKTELKNHTRHVLRDFQQQIVTFLQLHRQLLALGDVDDDAQNVELQIAGRSRDRQLDFATLT